MSDHAEGNSGASNWHVFISRAGKDSDIAIIVADILRGAGYRTFLQDEDFRHTSFMAKMKEAFDAVDSGARVVCLLSHAYQASEYCQTEAQYPLIGDPQNKQEQLIVLRIEECAPTDFLKPIPYIDLVPLLHDQEAFARAVRGSLNRRTIDADYAALYRRSSTQILHPEIRAVPGFTGRQDLLNGLRDALWGGNGSAALTNADTGSAAIHGLGGVGKTALAKEYAWRNRNRYHGIWWLRAEERYVLYQDLIALGSRLIPALDDIDDRERAARLALDALSQMTTDGPWLLIYDNAENPAAIETLMPRANAHTIITSRWSDWHGHASELPVDVFTLSAATDYLLAHARHPDRAAAERLANALGCLPLALSHARATCWHRNWDFDRYHQDLADLLKKKPRDASYPSSVYATFRLAIEKVAEESDIAKEIMQMAAFLAPERIPLSLFMSVPDIVQSEVEDAIAALAEVSLITHETLSDGGRGISVHRLIQAIIRSDLAPDDARLMAHASLNLVSLALQKLEGDPFDESPIMKQLSPHAMAAIENNQDREAEYIFGITLKKLSGHFNAIGDHATAKVLSERLLKIVLDQLDPNDFIVGLCLNDLASEYLILGRYVEAESLLNRATEISESTDEHDASYFINILINSSVVLLVQGRFQEALQIAQRALDACAIYLADDHPTTGFCLSIFGQVFAAKGEFAKAISFFHQAADVMKKALGDEHPHLAIIFLQIGNVLYQQGQHNDAKEYFERAVPIYETMLGFEHWLLAWVLNNLALVYMAQKKFEDAEPPLKRAIKILGDALGADHPGCGQMAGNLGALYTEQQRYDEAETQLKRALDICKKKLAADHPEFTRSFHNLAHLYREMERYEDAELHLLAVIAIEQKVAFNHPSLAYSLGGLAHVYYDQGLYAKAKPWLEQALELAERKLGEDHPQTRLMKASMDNLLRDMQSPPEGRSSKRKKNRFLSRFWASLWK